MHIILNNQTSMLECSRKRLVKIRKVFAIKDKKAFWSPAFRRRQWDGWVRYISEETGRFYTGLLPQLIAHIESFGWTYTIEDKRPIFKDLHRPTELGGLEFRDYQEASRKAALDNRFKGKRFQRGILAEATNAGKSLIAGGIFASFSNKRIGLFLVNGKTLFEQAYADFCKLLGTDQVGRINSTREEWKRVNICMVQTLGSRMKKSSRYKNSLAKVDIIIVDEVDEVIGRKDCQYILAHSYNATIRYGLSGTPLMHKDPLRNQEQLKYFGPIIHSTTNKQLVDKGVSTPPDIRILSGNKEVEMRGDYKGEELRGILLNRKRHKRIWRIVLKHEKAGRFPILILFREHKHAYDMLECIPKELEYLKTVIVHHETKTRVKILEDFNNNKIEILIASMIIKRGKNLPRIKVLVNAAGGDSQANVLQIFGRALRSHKSKKKVYIYDFFDKGKYLQRHSKHRITYYKRQGFPVKELYKGNK